MDRGVAWLLDAQEADGSWFGRWGANHVYGTGAVVPALVAAGIGSEHPAVRRGRRVARVPPERRRRLGRGPPLLRRPEPRWAAAPRPPPRRPGPCSPCSPPGERGPSTDAGVEFLVATQRADGTWDEPWFTGTGFPGDFYINYHLYRLVFPVMALGRYSAVGRTARWLTVVAGPWLTSIGPLRIEAMAVGGDVPRHRDGQGARRPPRGSGWPPRPRSQAVALVGRGRWPRSRRSGSGSWWWRPRCATVDGSIVRALPGAQLDRRTTSVRRASTSAPGPSCRHPACVRSTARAALAAAGAIAVDMESAWLADPLPDRAPVAVVRAISDTAQGGVADMALGGMRALVARCCASDHRSSAGPAPCGRHEVVLAAPRSFCAGVERAIEIVERAIERFGAPVYVRRQIVHNTHVVADLEAKGAVFVRGARRGARRCRRGPGRPRRLPQVRAEAAAAAT